MTNKQKEFIKDNLNAYITNFGYIKIVSEDYGKGFYIFTDEQRAETGDWTQYCYNIDYLNGWLFGDYTCNDSIELEKAFSHLHFNW